jgi:hypothetical protein
MDLVNDYRRIKLKPHLNRSADIASEATIAQRRFLFLSRRASQEKGQRKPAEEAKDREPVIQATLGRSVINSDT